MTFLPASQPQKRLPDLPPPRRIAIRAESRSMRNIGARAVSIVSACLPREGCSIQRANRPLRWCVAPMAGSMRSPWLPAPARLQESNLSVPPRSLFSDPAGPRPHFTHGYSSHPLASLNLRATSSPGPEHRRTLITSLNETSTPALDEADSSASNETGATLVTDLGLIPELLDAVADMGFTTATPIQAGAIPVVLQGRDFVGCASTGTGKTAAFLLPILQLLKGRSDGKVRCLILSPTRELALQIDEQALALGYHVGLSAAAVVGGLDMGPQERALRAGAVIVVATPGRLMDHMRYDYVDLSQVEIVVLDEADRMLDMGFLPDIQRIFSALPKKRQTLLFSATMAPPIRKLAEDILDNPAEMTVDRQAPNKEIVQTLHPVSQERKTALLAKLLCQPGMDSVLVFVRRKLDVNRVASSVRRAGVEAGSIHSGKRQEDRIAALEDFRAGRTPVLIATDVAARGLDVNDISHVINFDVPHSPEDYIHRAGRTARAGKTGDVITFVSPDEEDRLHDIQRTIGMQLPRTVVPGFECGHSGDGPPPRRGSSRGRGPRGGESRGGESRGGNAPRGRSARGDAPSSDAPSSDAPRAATVHADAPADTTARAEAPRSEDGAPPRRRRRRGGRGGKPATAPAAAV
jgi:ATP-dependent RNA helicase RhlE